MNHKNTPSTLSAGILQKSKPYLLVFFLSLLILDGLLFFIASGFGYLVPGSLHLMLNFFNALAGVSFCFYLKHTKRFENLPGDFCILLSVSYGLCAYGLLQETNLRYLIVFILFPLLFYAYERMMEADRLLFYILLLTLCFFTDYMLTAMILIALILHVLLFTEGGIGIHIRRFFKLAGYSCIALLVSGIITFPQYAEYFSYIGNEPYTGFSTTLPVITALSRFLLGSVSSAAFFSGIKLDLYFGVFFFIMAASYFLLSHVSGKEKLKNFLYIFLLFAAAEFGPVYFLVNFFRMYSGGSIYYSFLPVFFLLLLAAKALASIDAFSFAKLLKLGAFSLIYLAVCLFCAGHNYHPLAKQSNIFFFIAYILLLLAFSLKDKISFPVKPLLICLVTLELFCNAFIVTNQNFIPAPLTLADHYPDFSSWQVYPALNGAGKSADTNQEADSAQQNNGGDSDFAKEIQSGLTSADISDELSLEDSEAYQYMDSELTALLNAMPSEEILTDADKDAAGITSLSDYFTIQNAIVRKLGADEDLFIPADFTLDFTKTDDYRVADLGNNIYAFSYVHDTKHGNTRYYDMKASLNTDREGTLVILDTLNLQLYRFDTDNGRLTQDVTFYLPLSPEYTVNDHLNGYWLNTGLLEKLPALTKAYEALHQSQSFTMLSQYLGIGATCIGIFLMLLLFFNKDKEKIFTALHTLAKKVEDSRILSSVDSHFKKNKFYWLSFLIPWGFFLLALIINSCTPFGGNSIFDEDGLYLTYPSNLDIYYNLKEGHALYSFLGGYGYSLFAVNPLALTRFFTTLLSPGQIAPFLTLEEGFFLGLSGLSLAFYLTHRLVGKRADKEDGRILIPVMIYTLNNYMLCMHGFTSWYQIFAALPLVLLAMDYFMLRKKCVPYIIALTYCIYANLYLALYICIFLVIRFFIYHFRDFKDFLFKGLRFAGCSILAALNSFFIIANTLLATWDSAYQIEDSTFPTPGFHGNFFSQWKQHMIFSEVGAVNWNENYVCLYAGIGALLLLLIFCLSKKISLSHKLRTLIPIAILYISFNGKFISFIWNGFHYQTGVPNRYAFLFMFMIAILAYDALDDLKDLKLSSCFLTGSILLIFFICCQFIGSGNSTFAFTATLITTVIYLIFFVFHALGVSKDRFIYRTFPIILGAELFCNMLFAFTQYNLPGIYKIGDVDMIHTAFQDADDDTVPLARTLYAATPAKNGGAFYQTESNEIFNSFVTMHQSNLNIRYGMTGGTNYITTVNAATPLSLSLSGTRFVFCCYFTENPCHDLKEYRYLGSVDGNYIFENPYALPLGIYAPEELTKLDDYSNFVPYYLEELSSFYLSGGTTPFSHQLITYDETASGENIFYYTDENDRILSFEEVNEILAETNQSGNNLTPMDTLYINISATPEKDGPLYLYSIEFVSLGYAKSGESFQCRISFPTANLPASNDLYNLTVFNSESMPEFYENANKFTLDNLTYTGHTLTGVTNYEEDGYTMLSIPYDRGWKAYIDGEEVSIEDPYQSMMFVKTPAGHHELKLVFIPYGMVVSLAVTGGSIVFTCLLFLIISRLKRKHPESITK